MLTTRAFSDLVVPPWVILLGLFAGLWFPASSLADWTWSSQVTTLSSPGQDARIPQVASNNNSVAVATWSRFDGFNWIVQSARLNKKGVWGKASSLSRRGGNAALPRVAMDSNGNARAVWIRYDGFNDVVESAYYDVQNSSWTDPARLSDTGRNTNTPDIAMNATGQTAVVWTSYNGANWVVQARLNIQGVPQSIVTLSSPQRDALTPRVAIDNTGAVTVTWIRFDGATNIVQSIRYRQGAWGDVADLSGTGLDAAKLPQTAVDDAGNVTVVWMEAFGQLFNIQSRRWISGTGWEPINQLTANDQNAAFPQVAADGAGTAIAIWTQQNVNGTWSVRTRRCNKQGVWGNPTVFADVGQDYLYPQIATDNSGAATGVWMRSEGTLTQVRGSHYLAGSWTPSAALTNKLQNASLPSVAMMGNDRATVVWLRTYATNNLRVQAKQGEYVVNRYRLTVNRTGSGNVLSTPAGIDCGETCTVRYDENTEVTLTATPDEGYNFIGWSGACQGAANCVLTMAGNRTVGAKFVASADFAVKIVRSPNGVVTSDPTGIQCGGQSRDCKYPFGKDAQVTLIAEPAYGYYFKSWSGCDAPDGSRCVVDLNKPITRVKARFTALPKYVLRIDKTRFGSIVSDPTKLKCGNNARTCSTRFVTGTTVSLTAVPAPGRIFTGWGGDCGGQEPTCNVLMDMKRKISASFQ